MSAVAQLFARMSQEIQEKKPENVVHFIVGFLCKHYPEHLHGFASIWQMDPDLERERHEVVNFFKSHKISTAVAAHFTNAGYDTLDTLTTLSPDNLVDIEAFNNVKWLPGHKVRLQQIFSEISARIRAYKQMVGPGARNTALDHHHHAAAATVLPAAMAASPVSYAAPALAPAPMSYPGPPMYPQGAMGGVHAPQALQPPSFLPPALQPPSLALGNNHLANNPFGTQAGMGHAQHSMYPVR